MKATELLKSHRVIHCPEHNTLIVGLPNGSVQVFHSNGESEWRTQPNDKPGDDGSVCDWVPWGPVSRERSPAFPCLGLVRLNRGSYVTGEWGRVSQIAHDDISITWQNGASGRWPKTSLKELSLVTDNPDYPPDPKLVELFTPPWQWPEVLKGFWGITWGQHCDDGFEESKAPWAWTRPPQQRGDTWSVPFGDPAHVIRLTTELVRALGITLPPKPADWRTPVLNPNWQAPAN